MPLHLPLTNIKIRYNCVNAIDDTDHEGRFSSEFVGRKSQSRVKRIAAMSATCDN